MSVCDKRWLHRKRKIAVNLIIFRTLTKEITIDISIAMFESFSNQTMFIKIHDRTIHETIAIANVCHE